MIYFLYTANKGIGENLFKKVGNQREKSYLVASLILPSKVWKADSFPAFYDQKQAGRSL